MYTLDANSFDISDMRRKGNSICLDNDEQRKKLKNIIANLQKVGFFPFQDATEYEQFSFSDINDYEPDIVYVDFTNEPSEHIYIEFKESS